MSDDKRYIVAAGDAAFTGDEKSVLLTRNITSCMAVAGWDQRNNVAGLMHPLLPDSRMSPFPPDSIAFSPYRYIDTAFSKFIKYMSDKGASKQYITLIGVGGARIFDDGLDFDIGYRNIIAFRKAAWKAGTLISTEKLGGNAVRDLILDLENENITLITNKEEFEYF